jgi:SAM-dependent methyltransferase
MEFALQGWADNHKTNSANPSYIIMTSDPEPASEESPPYPAEIFFKNQGTCPCCDQSTTFVAHNGWLRDFYLCSSCGCIPRERALMYCIERFFPNWRGKLIHESSPCDRGASIKLRAQAPGYLPSQFFLGVKPGTSRDGWLCQDLENLGFDDESIDLHVTQDVLEHIFDPAATFREIARTLRPGGMHIFTVPIVNKTNPTQVCAVRGADGNVTHLREPEYHGNPVSNEGSLVIRRWGYDICDFIFRSSGLFTEIIYLDILEHGIRAEYIEVLITRKPAQVPPQSP